MTGEESPRFVQALVALAELHGVELSAERQALYFEALADLPLEAVLAAIAHSARVDRFVAKPAELRGYCGGSELTATEIYERVVALLRRSPIRLPPDLHPFDDFVIRALGGQAAVLTMDGQRLRYLCEQRAEEWLEVARVRGLMLPPRQRGEGAPPALPPPAAPLALPPPSRSSATSVRKPPADKAEAVSDVRSIRAAAEAVLAAGAAATEEQIAARRAVLREQARQLGVTGKDDPDGAVR